MGNKPKAPFDMELYNKALANHEEILASGGFVKYMTGTEENTKAIADLGRDLRLWIEGRRKARLTEKQPGRSK